MHNKLDSQEFGYTTKAYKREVLRLVLAEASKVAKELQLSEKIPITETDLVESFVPPPAFAKMGLGFGTVSTTNYDYAVTVGNKFSYLIKYELEQEYQQLKAQYLWPMSRKDTNAAYQLAVQWLKAASMDVNGLNRDCQLQIYVFAPEGEEGVSSDHFVPLYSVCWSKKAKRPLLAQMPPDTMEPVATVKLFLPTKSLLQMDVNASEYILRKPLQVTNLDYLLGRTNATQAVETKVR